MKTDSTSVQDSVINMVDDTHARDGLPMAAARHRLALALHSGREACVRLQEKTVAGAKAADKVVRKHPYHVMGIAAGLGALIGFLLLRRRR